jgi:hypothetical protein
MSCDACKISMSAPSLSLNYRRHRSRSGTELPTLLAARRQ